MEPFPDLDPAKVGIVSTPQVDLVNLICRNPVTPVLGKPTLATQS